MEREQRMSKKNDKNPSLKILKDTLSHIILLLNSDYRKAPQLLCGGVAGCWY